MAQSITLRELEVTDSVEHVVAVKAAIYDLERLLGEGITEEVASTASALLGSAYSAGYSMGPDADFYVFSNRLHVLLGEGMTLEIIDVISRLAGSAYSAGCWQGFVDSH